MAHRGVIGNGKGYPMIKLVSILGIPLALGLSGCGAATAPAPDVQATQPASADVAIRAFKDVCLATAPSFAGAKAAAKQFGVADIIDGIGGMTKDGSLSIQIKLGKECATTSASRPGNATDAEFRAVIIQATGANVTSFPSVVVISGTQFLVQHDRKGGEAYVLLKK